MSKAVKEAKSFFKKTVQAEMESDFVEGFQITSPIKTPSIAIPINVQLSEKEFSSIQKILVDDYMPGNLSEQSVSKDLDDLTNITKQIKSISAQSVLLHGERIKQAQQILSKYRDGAFTKWLETTYGNRQTPYSMLRYYEFYQEASYEEQKLIEEVPKKCVYLLASKDGDQAKKMELIKQYGKTPQSDFILIIQETFPMQEKDKRKPVTKTTVESMCKLCKKLESRSKYITDDDRADIQKLIDRLQKL